MGSKSRRKKESLRTINKQVQESLNQESHQDINKPEAKDLVNGFLPPLINDAYKFIVTLGLFRGHNI